MSLDAMPTMQNFLDFGCRIADFGLQNAQATLALPI